MKTISSSISRRALLRATGTSAASLPFFKLLENSAVEAQATNPKMRFLCIYVPDGHAYEYFRPRLTAADKPGSGKETDFTLDFEGSVLQPLVPFLKKSLIIDALDFACRDQDLGLGHNALGTILTGSPNIRGEGNHAGPSLDHKLSTIIGKDAAVPKINVCVGPNYNWAIHNQFVFSGNGSWQSEILNPATVYDKLFNGFQAPGTAPDPALANATARKHNKLKFILGDVNRLRDRIGAEEKKKLDVHVAALRSIEMRLDAVSASTSSCTKPARPGLNKDYLTKTDGTGPDDADVPMLFKLNADILAQGFACDRTRVATLRLAHSPGTGMPYLGTEFAGDTHNAWQHNATSYRSTWKYDAISRGLAKMQNHHYQLVAYMLKALDAIPEGNGTVLDNTIVMVACEMGNTALHNSSDIVFTLAGGGGKFRMGRYLKAKPENGAEVAHNKLLVSILNAFGIADQSFGWNGSTGPLAGLT